MLLVLSFNIMSCNTSVDDKVTTKYEESDDSYFYEEESEDVDYVEETEPFIYSFEIIDGTWYLCTDETIPKIENNMMLPNGMGFLTFKNMKEFKEQLTNLSFGESDIWNMVYFPRDENGIILCDPDSLKELTNLPDGYEQIFIEWLGGDYYIINYKSKDEIPMGVYIKSSEEELQKYMTDVLANLGNYEELQKNKNILNLTRTMEITEMGEMEVCQYDTSSYENLKTTYIEFTYNYINYVISTSYWPDDILMYSQIFVFDGENSFSVGTGGNKFTYDEIVSLKLSYVKLLRQVFSSRLH